MKKDIKPWHPADYEVADIQAIQSLQAGNADEFQQRRALKWIVEVVSATYDQSFRPGSDGERDTCFAEGRRFVGLTIVKATKLNVSNLLKKRPEEA